MDISKAVATMMGDGADQALVKSTKFENAAMTSTMYYDYEDALPRWLVTEMMMRLSMPDLIAFSMPHR